MGDFEGSQRRKHAGEDLEAKVFLVAQAVGAALEDADLEPIVGVAALQRPGNPTSNRTSYHKPPGKCVESAMEPEAEELRA